MIADLSGKIDVIIDGGKTRIGIESTVIDMTTSPPTLLRPGGLSVEDIEKVVGHVQRLSTSHENMPARSPGMKYRHYAPKARMVIVEGDSDAVQSDIIKLAEKGLKDGQKVGILAFHKEFRVEGCITKYAGSRCETVAGRLFDILRAFDKDGVDLIISEPYDGEGLKLGIADRLRRAAGQGKQ